MEGGAGRGGARAQMKEEALASRKAEAPAGSKSSFLPPAWACRVALGKSLSSQDGSSPAIPRDPYEDRPPPPRCQRLPCPARHSLQAWLWQYTEGTHRLEEPVSKRTRKFCGGVPRLISPK